MLLLWFCFTWIPWHKLVLNSLSESCSLHNWKCKQSSNIRDVKMFSIQINSNLNFLSWFPLHGLCQTSCQENNIHYSFCSVFNQNFNFHQRTCKNSLVSSLFHIISLLCSLLCLCIILHLIFFVNIFFFNNEHSLRNVAKVKRAESIENPGLWILFCTSNGIRRETEAFVYTFSWLFLRSSDTVCPWWIVRHKFAVCQAAA